MNEEVLANHTLVCAGKSTMIYQTSRSIYYFILCLSNLVSGYKRLQDIVKRKELNYNHAALSSFTYKVDIFNLKVQIQ